MAQLDRDAHCSQPLEFGNSRALGLTLEGQPDLVPEANNNLQDGTRSTLWRSRENRFSTGQFGTTGDINESLATLWYHDHRVDFTSQNTYKGLTGFYCLFNSLDTGDESTGSHLPSFPQFDIPLHFSDKVFDPNTGWYNWYIASSAY